MKKIILIFGVFSFTILSCNKIDTNESASSTDPNVYLDGKTAPPPPTQEQLEELKITEIPLDVQFAAMRHGMEAAGYSPQQIEKAVNEEKNSLKDCKECYEKIKDL